MANDARSSVPAAMVSHRYRQSASPASLDCDIVVVSNHKEYLILLALEKPRALLAALQEVLEVTFPAVSIEGIRQLDLHNVFREEGPECITCIAPFPMQRDNCGSTQHFGF